MKLGRSNHIDKILMKKCSKVLVFWKIFKVLSIVKFYRLEVLEWKEVQREWGGRG